MTNKRHKTRKFLLIAIREGCQGIYKDYWLLEMKIGRKNLYKRKTRRNEINTLFMKDQVKFNNISAMPKRQKNKQINNSQSFVQKLQMILEDDECQDYIHWTADEDSFIINDITKFTEVVLPKYFKKIHFSSFIRQLNMYGFKKIRHVEGQNAYKNQNFTRNNDEELKNIKRKINGPTEKQDRVVLYNPNNSLTKQLRQLKTRQTNLEGMCQQLVAQNKKIIEENNEIMKELSSRSKEKNSKMEQILLSLILAKGGGQLSLKTETPKMLSIANQQHVEDGGSSPINLENLQQLLEDSQKMRQIMKMFPKQQKKRRKNRNFTIVNDPSPIRHKKESVRENSQQRDEQNLLSISDFLNMQSPMGKMDDLEDHH